MNFSAKWWQSGVIYQIYPRSFQDTNGDGIGDLEGIRRRLSYLVELGVDAIWISPIYPSPMCDFGYDVSDYRDIDPTFGTLEDFDSLLEAAHAKGLKVILDFVPNHTSDRHAWFEESRSSRLSPKREWYVWRDGRADGSPPNNWQSEFGGPAWTLDPSTGQYYYHAFLKEQPDLNWRNPDVGDAMCDVLRFWLERGVDGFRVDAIHHLIEDEALRDNPINPAWRKDMPAKDRWIPVRTVDQPETHAAIEQMRRVADGYPDRVLIGEAYLPIDRLMAYYGVDLGGFQLPFNFHLISARWEASALAAVIHSYERALPTGGWPNWVLGNHDRSRVASRIGPEQARVAAMLLLTLRGTPTLFQGEEIGMTDVAIAPEEVRDPFEKNVPGLGLGRDPARTPLRWAGGHNAGFTSGEPWLPIGADADGSNVAAQTDDPKSMLSLYRALLRLRRSEAALRLGAYAPRAGNKHVLAYERRSDGDAFLIALNLSGDTEDLPLPKGPHEIVLSTYLDNPKSLLEDRLRLRAHEGLVLRESIVAPAVD